MSATMTGQRANPLGFLYTFLLLLQGSLFFTRLHVNKYWGFALGTAVLIHGTVIGITKIHQITWIPLTYYATALVLALLMGGGAWLVQAASNRHRSAGA